MVLVYILRPSLFTMEAGSVFDRMSFALDEGAIKMSQKMEECYLLCLCHSQLWHESLSLELRTLLTWSFLLIPSCLFLRHVSAPVLSARHINTLDFDMFAACIAWSLTLYCAGSCLSVNDASAKAGF